MNGVSTHELRALERMTEILEDTSTSPAQTLEALYETVFANERAGGRMFRLREIERWSWTALKKTLEAIERVATAYVQRFQDPRELPVTHSKRQKRLAIHLDEQFGPVLREAVVRSGIDPHRHEDGTPVPDPFLDEPILYLKQLARAKDFPHAKKGGGASLPALRERFTSKLADKGFRDLPPPSERFEIKTPG